MEAGMRSVFKSGAITMPLSFSLISTVAEISLAASEPAARD
jgi:hypothetical protein